MRSSMFNIFNGASARKKSAREADQRRAVTQQAANAKLAYEALSELPYDEALRLFEDVISTRAVTAPQATRYFAQTVDRHVDELERI